VLPRLLEQEPRARLVVVGSDPPPRYSLPHSDGDAIELRGFVEDVLEPLSRYAVFVCPILSGSGVRVKLLEAFASGIPVVSTRLGAEGLTTSDGEVCALSDDPEEFADKILYLFEHAEEAREMARRGRAAVEKNWHMPELTRRLIENYRALVRLKRSEP
jgi:glycosyltransferase involved in cell wall biosynthesis